ncbi:MAG TPA: aldehyde dehydrogenase family protein [Candidatus Binataceae bacterium]|nr:aldehyde dehydrogenase family protein [Candidatus Binataceae bacterium]
MAANLKDFPMLIGGEMTASRNAQWLTSINPADETELGRTPAGAAEDVNRAVEAAEAAQPAWNELTVTERGKMLRKVAAGLRERAKELLEVEVADTGNTIGSLAADVEFAASGLEYYAGLGTEMKGETIPATSANLHFTLCEPYGVVGRIIPFNHPILFAASRMAAPLMAGNAIVIKPAETSPLSASIFGDICRQILPPGVVNIVTGLGNPAGDALVRHPRVKRIAFTGSVATGMAIQRSAAETGVKNVTLELGGKNPLIVFPDVDLDTVAKAAVGGMNFSWQGQSCGSTSRLMVHESIYPRVLERVADITRSLKVGSPNDPTSQMGPINSARQYEKVKYYIGQGKEEGARLVTGGSRPSGKDFERGYWIEPTIFADVQGDMRIAREEIFGPVLSVFRWDKVDDVMKLANSTDYGLTASIWTNDLKTALNAARRVRSGFVWINQVSAHYIGVPFGGYGNSGTGREEGLSELMSYVEHKSVNVMLR